MTDIDAWRVFIAVIDHGGIARAAEKLGTVKSAVSRRITRLEKELGTALMTRTTRRMTLTDTGRVFYDRARDILADVQTLEASVAQVHGELTGRIRLTTPLTFGLRYVTDALNEFMRLHPAIQMEIEFSDRRTHIIDDGFDLALRLGPLESSSLIARRLCPIRYLACASPEYIASHGHPRRPEELKQHPFLGFSGLAHPESWTFTSKDGRRGSVKVPIRLLANNGDHLVAAAIAGHGVLLEPTFIVADAIASRRLVPILRHVAWRETHASLVYPPTRHLSGRVRALIDSLVARFPEDPPWDRAIRSALRSPQN